MVGVKVLLCAYKMLSYFKSWDPKPGSRAKQFMLQTTQRQEPLSFNKMMAHARPAWYKVLPTHYLLSMRQATSA